MDAEEKKKPKRLANIVNKRPHLKVFVVCIVGLLLLIAVGIVLWRSTLVQNKSTSQKTSSSICSQQVIQEAAAFMGLSKSKQLEPIVARIQQLKDYDSDANCLDIVTTYYAYSGDYKNASTSLDKLEKVYDKQQGFSEFFGSYANSIEKLRQYVDFLKLREEQFQKNTKAINGL